ncbi:type II toxin-antitoxin system RelE/ParE family toxin [Sphingomonas pituitosa]|uniref:type II toxin-antitoxin system RelE/ParE family toxin n=1 Tax=Sphingomonas pituitosa TaxID=99597 RepID=UPI000AA98FF7|nr:type II toxin-antitoxin system RelE/ParE family toxin [Sphingomonas pituitosa]
MLRGWKRASRCWRTIRISREREELRQRLRAFRYKAHLIFYHAQADGILILRLRHGREDWLADD